MKKILVLFLVCIPILTLGQYDIEEAKKDTVEKKANSNLYAIKQNTYVGTSLNLSIGNLTFIYISPQIGYDFHDQFSIGLQGLYQFTRFRIAPNAFYTLNSYGGGVFARFRPIENICFETSFNLYNTDQVFPSLTGERVIAKSLLFGLGYTRPIGDKAYTFFNLYYNFIDDLNMPEPLLFRSINNSFLIYYKFGFVAYPFG